MKRWAEVTDIIIAKAVSQPINTMVMPELHKFVGRCCFKEITFISPVCWVNRKQQVSVDCRTQLGLDRQFNIGNRHRLASTSSVKGTFAFQCVRSCRFIHIILVRCESTAVIGILLNTSLSVPGTTCPL